MSNETKRDVFDAVWNRLAGYQVFFNGWPRETLDGYKKRYDAALPDDLPVIPKAVGDVIVKLKHKKFSLSGAMSYAAVVSLSPWMTFEHEDTFALAWVLGAWKVEETGEVVKL
ncbi:hypothetical protein [Lacticaseibacillus rhamnosus]|uniref:hypothetical protein n=1 Tax=Lacticaseibacillus rhamnosus TaxID=47715 RepID=UPI0027999469|nr:hypothetical protein [Lacticaseibacillus rhamnosus]WBF77282.1 hypothetical protein [Lacticaseibacillus phage R24.1]WNX05131.1 hypothetical protein RWA21_08770 [Lacticaseibacillus rhamnosus]